MRAETKNPAVSGGRVPQISVQLGSQDIETNTASHHQQQAFMLRRRFVLSSALALAISELAFGRSIHGEVR